MRLRRRSDLKRAARALELEKALRAEDQRIAAIESATTPEQLEKARELPEPQSARTPWPTAISVVVTLCLVAAIIAAIVASPRHKSTNIPALTEPTHPVVYRMSRDGTGQRLVAGNDAVWAMDADWAPDGRRFAYIREMVQGIPIVTADGQTQEGTAVTFPGLTSFAPDWAPDGKRIAYSAGGDIYVTQIGGMTEGSTGAITGGPGNDTFSSWSPNGKEIAFERDGQIYRMDSRGHHVHQLTKGPFTNGFPAWSPDGKRIVFTSARDRSWELYAMNRDGSHAQRLTNNGWSDAYGTWAPDGKTIAFSSDRAGNWDIYAMPATGGAAHRLTTSPNDEKRPSWSPKGDSILFWRDIGESETSR
jgi:Tol biopolymer transport system component